MPDRQKNDEGATGVGSIPSGKPGPTIAHYRFAHNPAMRRAWLRNIVFGFAIALPLALFGLGLQLWAVKDLLLVFGTPVVTSMVLLPLYAAIVRELG